MKINKTNAARLLDKAKIAYELIPYEVDENDLSAIHVAASLGENIEQVQGRNGAEIGENRIDPDDPEHAGAHNHNHRGRNALADAPGSRDGAVHKGTDAIAPAHDLESLHACVNDRGLIGKQGKELSTEDQ